MQFLIDAQLPPLLAYFFQQRGHTAQHVSELLAFDVTGAEIFDLAIVSTKMVIFEWLRT